MNRRLIRWFLLVLLVVGCAPALAQVSVERAIEVFSQPPGQAAFDRTGLGVPLRSFNVQVIDRLTAVSSAGGYEVRPQDAAALSAAMLDDQRDPYARLCAARYLLDLDDAEARALLDRALASDNPRVLHNAAAVLRLHVNRDPSRQWGIQRMIRVLADDRLLGKHESLPDETSGDAHDDQSAVFEEICFDLGVMKPTGATEALMAAVVRVPQVEGAAAALGQIGDPQAASVLMATLLDERGRLRGAQARALGLLRWTEAVPILLVQLQQRYEDGTRYHERPAIEALGQIGDARAADPLRGYLQDAGAPYRSEARLALVLVSSREVSADLVDLLRHETQRQAQGKLIAALRQRSDRSTVARLAPLAQAGGDLWLRAQCIALIGALGGPECLDVLIAVLEQASAQVPLSAGGRSVDLHQVTAEALRRATGQDLGTDAAAWRRWQQGR